MFRHIFCFILLFLKATRGHERKLLCLGSVNDTAEIDSAVQCHCGVWLNGVNDTTEFFVHANISAQTNCENIQIYKGPRWMRIMKKTGVKTRDTVPILFFHTV